MDKTESTRFDAWLKNNARIVDASLMGVYPSKKDHIIAVMGLVYNEGMLAGIQDCNQVFAEELKGEEE